MGKSLKLIDKLNNRLSEFVVSEDVEALIDNIGSLTCYNSRQELEDNLSEGMLLNINTISSNALSIPCGDYMVWMTDPGHTMLVPVGKTKKNREVYENKGSHYELFTKDIVSNWRSINKVLSERHDEPPEDHSGEADTSETPEDTVAKDEYTKDTKSGEFRSNIKMSTVDRPSIVSAMQQQSMSVTDLADACGVDVPAISRILRIPKDTQGDPGGRNPSLPLAAKIADVLKADAEALFPDIFGVPKQDFHARQTPGNRGSGMTGAAKGSRRKGKATEKWTSGGGD